MSIDCGNVFGFPVAVSDVRQMSRHLAQAAATTEQPILVAAADVHVITRGVHDPEYGKVLHAMDVICPDGMPLVWRLRGCGSVQGNIPKRVSGPDLMAEMTDCHEDRPHLAHYLLGGDERTLQLLEQKLKEKNPRVNIAGSYSPPFRYWDEDDLADMRHRIKSSGAQVVWIGLGCPKQERWMASQKDTLPPAVYVGVGAAFDFHAGTVRRAPLWMQRNGLEWFYRLLREPKRLFKRYFTYNTLFIWYTLLRK